VFAHDLHFHLTSIMPETSQLSLQGTCVKVSVTEVLRKLSQAVILLMFSPVLIVLYLRQSTNYYDLGYLLYGFSQCLKANLTRVTQIKAHWLP